MEIILINLNQSILVMLNSSKSIRPIPNIYTSILQDNKLFHFYINDNTN